MARRRSCVVLSVVVVAAAALVMPAGAAARSGPRIKLGVPSPGQITIHVTRLTVRRAGRPPLPTRIRLRPVRPKALPRSVNVIWATRVIPRKRRVTYSTLVLVINRARPGTAGASQAPVLDISAEIVRAQVDGDGFSGGPFGSKETGHNFGNPGKVIKLRELVREDWIIDDQPVLSLPADVEPEPDSGTYDSPYAPAPRRIRAQDVLVAMMVAIARNVPIPEVAARIENQLRIDIDGDGDFGAPNCEFGAYTSPTKEITVPPVGEASSVGFDTPIPNASYYGAHNGYRNGGCEREDRFTHYNIEVLAADGSRVAWSYDDPPADGDDIENGRYCPVTDDLGQDVNHCQIFAPQLSWRGLNSREVKTYSVFVTFQNSFSDGGGSRHNISIKVAWVAVRK